MMISENTTMKPLTRMSGANRTLSVTWEAKAMGWPHIWKALTQNF